MTVISLGAWCDLDTRDGATGPSFAVHEFALLDDGRRITLHEERGFTTSVLSVGDRTQMDQWAFLTLDRMEQMVRDTVLPDDDSSDEHPWEWLVELLRQQGIESSPKDLQRVPYEVEFSARLRAKIAEHTEIPD